MLLRLIALLIALGLCAGVVQASDLGTVAEAALVEQAEETSELELLVTPPFHRDLGRTIDAFAPIMQPPRYQHLLFVFRPPRAPAFD